MTGKPEAYNYDHRQILAEQTLINGWYSSRAKCYDALMNHSHEIRSARKTLMTFLDIQRGHKLIEVGVGTGKNLAQYKRAHAEVVGVDINASMLDIAMERARNLGLTGIVLMEGDGRALPFCANQFDIGILTYALSAIPANCQTLSEIAGVVKPGGKIGVLDFCHSYENAKKGVVGISLVEIVSQSGLRVVHRETILNKRKAQGYPSHGIYVLEVG